MTELSQVRVTGPLAPFAAGFAVELVTQGYASQPAAAQLRLLAHVSRWLLAEGEDGSALNAGVVEAFVLSRRAAGYSSLLTAKALRPLLVYLRGLAVVPADDVLSPVGPVEVALERYRRYLLVERGLSVITARVYVDAVRPFLAGRMSSDGVCLDLAGLEAGDVTAFRRHALSGAVACGGQADDDGAALAAGLSARGRRDRPAAGRRCAVGRGVATGRFAEGAWAG